MVVKRIVANVATPDVQGVRQFYAELLELDLVMDLGWIATLATNGTAPVQISVASEGGSGTEVPNLSIEVENVDQVYRRAKEMGCAIVYPLTEEPWGLRRFFIRDPAGTLLNILAHTN